ncbi:YjfB family protein [Bacillus sp. FJAT-45350]|uniref:YjfB family protein n=1 Tax=Bacillus sp. FJAT-45350 TaxID=2011014 RepID=UPI000BB9112A|nr:YjfB family protein [Bacillus sp. FJAT-45350]
MNIAALSMAMNEGQVKQQASISIMKQAMGSAEQNADFLNKMMGDTKALEQAAQPHLGGSIDLKL